MPITRVLPANPKKLIETLAAAGLSQAEIARKAKCSQPMISRLATGFRNDCPYSLVVSLYNLVEKLK